MKTGSEIGRLGERLAEKFLAKRGFIVLHRNYKMGSFGEVDLIVRNKNSVRFVEVKSSEREFSRENISRENLRPEDRIDARKLNKIGQIAEMYMKNIDLGWQIDVVSVLIDVKLKKAKCEFIECVSL